MIGLGLAIPWLMRDPRRVKFALLGVCVVAALWSFRVWLVARDERAAAEAKIRQIEQLTETRQKELDAREAEVKAKQEAIDAAWANLDAERAVLSKSRLAIKGELAQGLDSLKTEMARSQGEIAAVPASELDAKIRSALAGLRDMR